MFEKAEMLYLYVETPLHAGSGSSVGVVDLPIQRERVTHYPLVQSTGLKGKLRAEADGWAEKQTDAAKEQAKVKVVFGPDSNHADDHAGALSPGDARLLLFPVRSLVGVFAWTTSRLALERLRRDLLAARGNTKLKVTENGQEVEKEWQPVGSTDKSDNTALVCSTNDVVPQGSDKVVLEEFAFTVNDQCAQVPLIAKWLADNAFPQTPEYQYFRDKVQRSLVILPEDSFRDFTQFATEIVTRVRINQETKTAAGQALWSEEHLPSDSVLYAPLHASRPRTETNLFNDDDGKPSAVKVLEFVKGVFPNDKDRLQLGGDETVGRGIVKLQFGGGN